MRSLPDGPHSPGSAETAVAIVGVGLRLPGGVSSLDAFWHALADGIDLVSDQAPADRFDHSAFVNPAGQSPGKAYTSAGGYLDDIAGFDADYFGISPKEASRIDPQHRLLLECAAEAFDDAGIDPAELAGSDTAVFIGISTNDYNELQTRRLRTYNAYTMAGAANSNAANRLSYSFDLRGPSAALDTACSSALSALHEACESVRSGASAVALAGGVNVVLGPYAWVAASHASMLSPTGRCHPFSALADGFVRAEGAGVFVLKPLSTAVTDGDRVHGVILGSAVNCDGRTAGLSMPSATAQAQLLQRAYAVAGVDPSEIAYIEAHGTGTQAGDPVECAALGAALGRRNGGAPIPVGSVKSNVGHLEAGAGVPGVCKALLILREGRIPRTLHSEPVNPAIDFAGLGLTPVTKALDLAPRGDRTVVGVNSFGFGGANAHVVLAAHPAAPPKQPGPREQLLPVLVSARTDAALHTAATRLADHLDGPAAAHFEDVAFSSCRPRARHDRRLTVLASGAAEAAVKLRGLAAGREVDGAATASAVDRGAVGFVFSGNGAAWIGMGTELLEADPAFAAEVARVEAVLGPLLGWSVRDELALPGDRRRWDHADVAQPLLFAVQAGLVAAMARRGIRPAAVAGHSVGEVAAAYCAGFLDLRDACLVIAERSRAQATTHGTGRMAAVGLSALDAEERLRTAGLERELVVAGINSDRDVTVSGAGGALERWGRELEEQGISFHRLNLEYAFHSPAMDGLRDMLAANLAGIAPGPSRIPLFSTVTGSALDQPLDADYWWRNIREPVRFLDAINAMLGEGGCDVLLEIGPHPILGGYLRRVATAADHRVEVVGTLTRTACGADALDAALARLLAAGADFDLGTCFPDGGRVVSLPAYPWQREAHWNGEPGWWLELGSDDAVGEAGHPLLGRRQATPDPQWQQRIDPGRLGWLADHRVGAAAVMPAAGYLDMVLSAGGRIWNGPVEVRSLAISAPLVLPFDDPGADVRLQTRVTPDDGRITVASRVGQQEGWTEHVRGRVRRLLHARPAALDVAALAARTPRERTAADHYARCEELGLRYGPAFRVLRRIRIGAGEVLADYRLTTAADTGHHAHPAALDGALQAAIGLLDEQGVSAPFLPVGVDVVRWWQPLPDTGRIHLRSRANGAAPGAELLVDLTVTGRDGTVALELRGARMRRFSGGEAEPVPVMSEVLRAAPLPGRPVAPTPLPAPSQVLERTAAARRTITDRFRTLRYRDLQPRLLAVSAHFAAAAARTLLPGRDTFTLADLCAAGVDTKHTPLLRSLLHLADGCGLVTPTGAGAWRHTAHPEPERIFAQALLDLPFHSVLVHGYGVCGRHLLDVLTGATDPLDLLFSESDALAARLYDSTPVMTYLNETAALLLGEAIANWPADRPLRVLEVGAGTGATTRHLLPLLPAARTHYTYTDVSAVFFGAARERFRAYDFLHFQTLDLDGDPAEQGFDLAGYDLVVAGHVLHATRDLAATVAKTAALLAPGGHLLAIEPTNVALMAGVFGLLDSFWVNTDPDLRPHGPLLNRDHWSQLLRREGYRDVVCAGDPEEPARGDLSVILAARAPDAPGAHRPDPPGAERRPLLIGVYEGNGAAATAARLAARAPGPLRRMAADSSTEAWAQALSECGAPADIVLLLDADDTAAAAPAAVTEQAVRHCAELGAIARATAGIPTSAQPRLWLVVNSHQPAPLALPPAPGASAAAWGAARALANEAPALAIRKIALGRSPGHPADTDAVVDALLAEIAAATDEDEVLLTAAGRFVPRLLPDRPRQRTTPSSAAQPFGLDCPRTGQRYELRWQSVEVPEPGPDEITIDVRAAGLNYRDIATVAGAVSPILPRKHRPGQFPFGTDCAGTVIAVGSAVHDISVGDRVCSTAPYRSSQVVVRADRAIAIPDGMSFAEAATIPVVFYTTQHSLDHLARLAPGETLLVHAAAGGMGLAAWQYARTIGATVIATAGTPAKRDLLHLLGMEHVLHSRDLAWADRVMEITGGQGVDVVLNSLAGEAVTRGIDVLKPGGRFIELGKRDILADNTLPLAPFLHNLSYFGVDIGPLVEEVENSPLMDACRDTIARRLHHGDYRPLPFRTYPAAQVADAFACLQFSRHFGKVVLTFDEPVPLAHRPADSALRPDATYLITGGLSGFGAETARFLADQGARHLVLCNRRGEASPEAPALLAELRDRGVTVTAPAVDVTDADAVERLFADIDTTGRPLAGVVHAAMVLDDGPLTGLTDGQLRRVIAPKVTGGYHLDRLTRARDLDFFVVYTSATTVLGHFQQSAYAGANMVLDALVRERRAAGLPGLSVQWGHIEDSGYVARRGIGSQLDAYGIVPVRSREALTVLKQHLLDPGAPVVAVLRFDGARLADTYPNITAPRTTHLVASGQARRAARPARVDLTGLAPGEAVALIADTLTGLLAQIMQTEPGRIDHGRRLDLVGVDSLMATELATAAQRTFGCRLTGLEISSAAHLTALAQLIQDRSTGTLTQAEVSTP
ncbi:SDR family NAD(P)-dependent oxidoreductase [Streptomyces sp. NPDC059070]|uniref:SDR family NAD(P)-dependent oxidoreductase n=1 Tax=Streptomyces sp. NPDC059070 TaxID=3346713 RepID=UPI0036BC25CF